MLVRGKNSNFPKIQRLLNLQRRADRKPPTSVASLITTVSVLPVKHCLHHERLRKVPGSGAPPPPSHLFRFGKYVIPPLMLRPTIPRKTHHQMDPSPHLDQIDHVTTLCFCTQTAPARTFIKLTEPPLSTYQTFLSNTPAAHPRSQRRLQKRRVAKVVHHIIICALINHPLFEQTVH